MQVMYDASGVRLHAGRQASVLNMIITELPPDHPVSDTRPLRDSLGHTPLQVCTQPPDRSCMAIGLSCLQRPRPSHAPCTKRPAFQIPGIPEGCR